ncbi:antirestriction protein (plasmid) [Legionella lytica]|uniref:Antirestriction protein n=1 Tax=Legionella lytica TaxID=96232 RepID=A0ABY4YDB1_9GAMM|nr:antirestriction protein [Legionella lytica]USQ15594.1 antirestriction protein [Legionella lytica]
MNRNRVIYKQLVVEKNRLNFLPKHVKRHVIQFENIIYYLAQSMCYQYSGGYWNFYELSNEGFFLAPALEQPLEMFVDGNGFNGFVSPEALSVIVTLFSINGISGQQGDDYLIDKYYALRDFAIQHPERDLILLAID